ncbi:hypothetical protein [Encephalitozoon cuniculi GB-M1]|uniref:Uncharacterized protein n=2 Tax=Encephalitozoon cuniculi TaxID=6035 RepID=Q8SUF1_ENCCU|nr:uncharacterized protein ECU10_0790 [Encephalitozoon cuniculi GB-M1]AGE96287.1 hypothetical protein ECU10_0790 [Encephalitozoon cuniculi]KMV65230.1 hypothetical protein M970_100700 [Encephalitozoon cuniculi EcunIII-L]CAD25798.1 hypothetical protein [Encephalitozoon cuniculi GB-M1]
MGGLEANRRKHSEEDGLLRSTRAEISGEDGRVAGPVANQIQHSEFEAFLESYFPEIDEEKFVKAVSETVIDEEWLEMVSRGESQSRREATVRGLVGCLVDDGDILDDCRRFLDERASSGTEEEGLLEMEEMLASSSGSVEHLIKMYREQVAVNNRRKSLLGKRLRERLAYQGYWTVLRAIDYDIESLFVKRKRKRKKKEGVDEKVRQALERRSEFVELFRDVSLLEDDYKDYEDLFDPTEDVDVDGCGIRPYDYFS